MAVLLRCVRCGHKTRSARFYRGPGEHRCTRCGGALVLADPAAERRSGKDRREYATTPHGTDWRSGHDRRETTPFR